MSNNQKQTREIISACIDLASNIQQHTAGSKNGYRVVNLAFLVRGKRLLSAISLLLEQDYKNAALILTRSLFELAITLRYISQDPKIRVPLFLDYEHVIRYEKIKNVISSNPRYTMPAEIEANYNKVKNKYPRKYNWAGICCNSFKDMVNKVAKVDKFGKKYEYEYDLIYYSLSEQAHNRVSKLTSTGESDEPVDLEILSAGCMYFLEICFLTCEAFALIPTFESTINQVKKEIETVLRQIYNQNHQIT